MHLVLKNISHTSFQIVALNSPETRLDGLSEIFWRRTSPTRRSTSPSSPSSPSWQTWWWWTLWTRTPEPAFSTTASSPPSTWKSLLGGIQSTSTTAPLSTTRGISVWWLLAGISSSATSASFFTPSPTIWISSRRVSALRLPRRRSTSKWISWYRKTSQRNLKRRSAWQLPISNSRWRSSYWWNTWKK